MDMLSFDCYKYVSLFHLCIHNLRSFRAEDIYGLKIVVVILEKQMNTLKSVFLEFLKSLEILREIEKHF